MFNSPQNGNQFLPELSRVRLRGARGPGRCTSLFLAALCVLSLPASPAQAVETDESAIRLTSCELYPLTPGARWKFRSGPLVLEERVVRHEKINDETCARIDTIFEERIIAFEHLAVRADGVYRVSVNGRPVEPPLKFLDLPAKPGATWKVESSIAGQTIRGEFQSTEQTLAIRDPHGDKDRTYQTHRVTGEKFQVAEAELSFTYDFAPKIGKVKQVVKASGQETVLEMTDYIAPGDLPVRTASRDDSVER